MATPKKPKLLQGQAMLTIQRFLTQILGRLGTISPVERCVLMWLEVIERKKFPLEMLKGRPQKREDKRD